jgi:MFS family permease
MNFFRTKSPRQQPETLHQPAVPLPTGRKPATSSETVALTAAVVVAAAALGLGVGVYSGVIAGIGALFHVAAGQLNWVNSVQLLSTVVCVPVMGRIGDMFGHRRALVTLIAITTVGAVLAATAPTFAVLLVGRALMGPIGGVFGLGPALVRDRLGLARGNTVIAALSGATLVGALIGLLLAANIAGRHDGVRIMLWICAGFYALATVTCLFAPESGSRSRSRMDWVGALALAAGLALAFLGLRQAPISGWRDAQTIGYLVAGVAVLAGWIALETRTSQPFVDVREMADRALLAPCVIAFVFGIASFGAQTAVITFMASPRAGLGYGLSLSIDQIAWWLLPCSVAGLLAALLTARIAASVGNLTAFLVGGGLLAAGFIVQVFLHNTTGEVVAGLAMEYAGYGVVQALIPSVLSEVARETGRGVITSFGESIKSLGGGLATAVFATLEASVVIPGTAIPSEAAYVWVWGICAVASAAFIPLALPLARARNPRGAAVRAEQGSTVR